MSKLTDFYTSIGGKHAAVVGIGISNTPLIDFLLAHNVRVTARDIKTREKLGELADALEAKGVKLVLGEGYLENMDEDIIFKAPGIRCDLPQFVSAVERGAILTSEMELFFELCPCKIFGVTGSDGKTTTTTLTHLLIASANKDRTVRVGGNIGKPLLPEIESIQPGDFAVLELSSFQLHTMKRSPFASAITNVTPNHLNWHTDMEEYTLSKENIFLHPGNQRLVLNWDNTLTRSMADRTDAEITFFSGSCRPPLGRASAVVYERDGVIVRETAEGIVEVLPVSDIILPGRHNVENYMTAIALTWGYTTVECIRDVASHFGGVEHRAEFVREVGGVKYYNSSIDSSPTRTEAALRAFKQKVIVICGGYDKHIPYEPLAKPLCECAKTVVLVGATAPKIKDVLLASPDYHGSPAIIDAHTFEGAVTAARDAAESGDIVILSPASASFDLFKNFEERGNYFKELVRKF
ncbi:MAG: UDP-N-acetylmuramoyl-L-alanine--D-glutamate ligase [Clostridia bacterium]|nr:UDP-N-acetylmuramoyl-L-alanine--D-glutamate ligase [Clostridia bacterium]